MSVKFRTRPTEEDIDGDGLENWKEIAIYGTDHLRNESERGHYDGKSDGLEVVTGSDPKSNEGEKIMSETSMTLRELLKLINRRTPEKIH